MKRFVMLRILLFDKDMEKKKLKIVCFNFNLLIYLLIETSVEVYILSALFRLG